MEAWVQVGKTNYEIRPNQVGSFQRIKLEAREIANVEAAYPQGEPGQTVIVEVKDGGHLAGGKGVEALKLDAQRQISFAFESGEFQGIYQVALRKGVDEKVLEFWVGPELSVPR